jgi:hypothetical protein
MTKEDLFLKSLEDIEKRAQSHDAYEILMIASILRKLLLDGAASLMYQVNNKHRIKVLFEINNRPAPVGTGVIIWSVQDGFDPQTSVPHLTEPLMVNLDQLLHKPVMLVSSEIITVADLVKYLSHVLGAVHAGKPSGSKEKALEDIEQRFQVGGYSATIRSLLAISQVVLCGLQPLKEAIISSTEASA